MTHIAARLALMTLALAALPGCAVVLAGTAGGLIVDEGIVERDGKFDPLENTAVGRAFDRTVN
ncbi:MAG: hypothetical protein AAF415_11845 [Pseudomonadota bacterium]